MATELGEGLVASIAVERQTMATGTFEDLMAVIARAEARRCARQHAVLPAKPASRRFLLETPMNLGGMLLARALELSPPELVLRAHDALFRSLASPHHYPFEDSPALAAAAELTGRIEASAGKPPAILALISHPPVMGDMSHLNFELVRHAYLALRRLRAKPCRPRLVVAVDPFALDTLSLAVEGLYAGFMGTYHLGLDRMCLERGSVSARLLAATAWHRMPYRLFDVLRRGGEVGMALSGGVTTTARALYALREWLGRRRRMSPLRGKPEEVRRRLREDAAFRSMEEGGCGPVPSVWRAMEAWAMAGLSGATGASGEPPAAETGRLTGEARAAAERCLEALALPAPGRGPALDELAEEVGRETPYRGRFFSAVARRVAASGRPLVMIPIVHRDGGKLGVEEKTAWAWSGIRAGRVIAWNSASPAAPWEAGVEEFSRRFVSENFS